MRRRFLILLLLLVPVFLGAQTTTHAGGATEHQGSPATEEHGEEHAKTWAHIPMWIWQLANMLLFIWILVRLLRKPVRESLRSRQEQVLREAEEAREQRAKADRLGADIQRRLSQIESDVRAIHQRAETEGERQKRELIAAAEAEAQKILQAARQEVENRLKRAREELTAFAGQLASDRAEKLLRENITDEDRKRLFERSVKDMGEVQA